MEMPEAHKAMRSETRILGTSPQRRTGVLLQLIGVRTKKKITGVSLGLEESVKNAELKRGICIGRGRNLEAGGQSV